MMLPGESRRLALANASEGGAAGQSGAALLPGKRLPFPSHTVPPSPTFRHSVCEGPPLSITKRTSPRIRFWKRRQAIDCEIRCAETAIEGIEKGRSLRLRPEWRSAALKGAGFKNRFLSCRPRLACWLFWFRTWRWRRERAIRWLCRGSWRRSQLL